MKKASIKIGGMHCASCAAKIESKLNKIKGVKSATVNFAAEKAVVDYDSNLVKENDLEKALKKTESGFAARIAPINMKRLLKRARKKWLKAAAAIRAPKGRIHYAAVITYIVTIQIPIYIRL